MKSKLHSYLTTALDLFAGAGGLTCGTRWAGLQVVQAIESNPHAGSTYAQNNPEVDLVVADIRTLDPRKCLGRLGMVPGEIDVIVAGPPCQGFSESNRRTRTLANPKNQFYREVLRFAAAIRPKCLIIENVAGLLTLAQGTVLKSIIQGCCSLGYNVEWKVLCAADYGVPQIRKRIFIVCWRLPIGATLPLPTHGQLESPYVNVRDAIDDLPVLRNGASIDNRPYRRSDNLSSFQRRMRGAVGDRSFVNGNLVTRNSDLILERYRHIGPGHNWESIPDALLANYKDVTRCHTGIYYRLIWHQPSKVLGNFRKNMLIHPSQHRGLSVREAARLQSFPDSYEFAGSVGFQQQQVADAVPPLLATAVVEHAMRAHIRAHCGGAT